MGKLSLRVKLIASYLCLAGIILAVGIVGSSGTSNTEKSLERLETVTFPKVNILENVVTTLTVFQRTERTLLIKEYFTDPDERENQFNILKKNWQKADHLMAQLDSLPMSNDEMAQWQQVKKNWQAWREQHNQVIDLVKNVDLDNEDSINEGIQEALDYSDSDARAAVIKARKSINSFQDLIKQHAEEAQAAAQAQGRKSRVISLTVGVIGVVFALSFGLFLSFFLTNSVDKVARRLTTATDEVAGSSAEIAESSRLVAEGASEQAASLEETSASMEELSAMTGRNAENSAQANALMKDTIKVIKVADDFMEEMRGSMEEISTASEETSKIIKTIDEIAFQTNLLALNAAVEAARAGEAGAGFAVVADEVRSLAMRAAEAAKNTSLLIEGTKDKVDKGREIVGKTSDAFHEVELISGKVDGLVGEITSASKEQAEGISQIRQAITVMDSVTQKNSATAEEAAAVTVVLNEQTETMKTMAADLEAIVYGQRTTTAMGGQEMLPIPVPA